MVCATCALVLERTAAGIDGVRSARFHFATQRGRVEFDPARTDAAHVLARLQQAGYACWQAGRVTPTERIRRHRRQHILRAGLALFLAMQVMMLTLPRYLGGSEVEPEFVRLLDGAAWALTLPVLTWCALPFYRGALRELRIRRPGMDSAVSLGLVLATVGSAAQSLSGLSAHYLDSISMTVALLLTARWFDWEQRQGTQAALEAARAAIPEPWVERITPVASAMAPVADAPTVPAPDAPTERVLASALAPGELIRILPGQAVPVDVALEDASAFFDESLRTGEAEPVERREHEEIPAGAVLIGRPAVLRVLRRYEESAEHVLWSQSNEAARPDAAALTDRVARLLMSAVIALAATTFIILASTDEMAVAIERTVALLVVTCPCALALAAPLARARAFAAALREGALLRRADALTRLARVTDFVFDKTGTLTEPARPVLRVLDPAFSEAALIHLIARIERAANHPLAETFRALAENAPPPEEEALLRVEAAEWLPGEGVEAEVAGATWRFGRPRFALAGEPTPVGNGSDLVLSREGRPIAVVSYEDRPLPAAAETLDALARWVSAHLLSGDHADRVECLRQAFSFASATGGLSAEAKARAIARMQAQGARIAMVGDGSNDAIALARADVSIAVGAATDHARGSADILLGGPTLEPLPRLMALARRSERIVLENLLWAGLYNAVMIPAAMLGWINPIVAATGMAASSALVTLNALRVRVAPPGTASSNPRT